MSAIFQIDGDIVPFAVITPAFVFAPSQIEIQLEEESAYAYWREWRYSWCLAHPGWGEVNYEIAKSVWARDKPWWASQW